MPYLIPYFCKNKFFILIKIFYLLSKVNNLILQWGHQLHVSGSDWIFPITLNTIFSISVDGKPERTGYNERDFVFSSYNNTEVGFWFSDGNYGDVFIIVIGI